MAIVSSSCIANVYYTEETKELRIYFTKGGGHVYSDVPKSVYDGLMAAPSKGKYFNSVIRNSYN